MALRQALGDQPAVVLRAAEDLGAVALNDEGEFHECLITRSPLTVERSTVEPLTVER